jgi:hypothetical protein
LQRYVGNIVNVTLNIVLVLAILGYFGVETTWRVKEAQGKIPNV